MRGAHKSEQYLCHSTAWQRHGEVITASSHSPMEPNAACSSNATLLLHKYPHPSQSFTTPSSFSYMPMACHDAMHARTSKSWIAKSTRTCETECLLATLATEGACCQNMHAYPASGSQQTASLPLPYQPLLRMRWLAEVLQTGNLTRTLDMAQVNKAQPYSLKP